MIRGFYFILFFLPLSNHLIAQKFEANIELGFNASQIDGDQFAGYSKVGLHGGLSIQYVFNDEWRLSTGLFYDALGSQKKIQIGSSAPEEQQKTQLTYISVPLLITYRLPSSSESGLSIGGGLQVGYLIDSKRPDFVGDPVLQYFSGG